MTMATVVPKIATAFKTLFTADMTTQWRNRKGFFLSLIVPVMILLPYKGHVDNANAAFVLSYSLSYGLIALGLMGYPNTIARDRDKGVFQRLRVAPIPTWAIMGSRLLVQLVMILIITLAIFIVGNQVDKIALSPEGYVLTFFTAIVGAAFYLSLGQLIVALIKNPDTVNSTSRFTFLFFILVGTFANIFLQKHELSSSWINILHWWPYGTINTVLAASMAPEKWNMDVTYSLMATLGYIALFLVIGMRKFTWENK
jgi:ABC-2 type transport system permease protein